MDNKEIDDLFFKVYGHEKLDNRYKEVARNSKAYFGFWLYIRLKEYISICKNKIKRITKALNK